MRRERAVRRERRRRRGQRRRSGVVGRVVVDDVDPARPSTFLLLLLPRGPSSSSVPSSRSIARRSRRSRRSRRLLVALPLLLSLLALSSLLVDSCVVEGGADDDGDGAAVASAPPLSMTCRSAGGGGGGGGGGAEAEAEAGATTSASVVECTFAAATIAEKKEEKGGGGAHSPSPPLSFSSLRTREEVEHCSEETGLCVRATVEVYPLVGRGRTTTTSTSAQGSGIGADDDDDDDEASFRGEGEGEASSSSSSRSSSRREEEEEDGVRDGVRDGDACDATEEDGGGTARSAGSGGGGRGGGASSTSASAAGEGGGDDRGSGDVAASAAVVVVGSATYEPPFARRYGPTVAEILRSIRSVPSGLPATDPHYVDYVIRRADLCVELGVAHRNNLLAAESPEGTTATSSGQASEDEYGMARNAFDEASRLYGSLVPLTYYEEERDAFELLDAEVSVYVAETILNYAPLLVDLARRGGGVGVGHGHGNFGLAKEWRGEGTKEALKRYDDAERIYRSVLERDDVRRKKKDERRRDRGGGDGSGPFPMDESSRAIAEINFADALSAVGVALLNVVVSSDDDADVLLDDDVVDDEEGTVDEGGGGGIGATTTAAGEAALRRATILSERAVIKLESAVELYRRRVDRDAGTTEPSSSTSSSSALASASRLADALYSLGSARTYLAEFDGAISSWEESLDLYRRLEETATTTTMEATEGEGAARAGTTAAADDDDDRRHRGALIAETLIGLSDAYVQAGRYDEAKARYAEAMRRYEAAGAAFDDDGGGGDVRSRGGGGAVVAATTASSSSNVRPSVLASDESLRSYRNALDAYLDSIGAGSGDALVGREVPIPDDFYDEDVLPPDELYEADLRSGLGYAHLERNDLRSALEELRAAADLYERNEDSADEYGMYEEGEGGVDGIGTALGDVWLNVANAHLRLGEHDESSIAFGRAADAYRDRPRKKDDDGGGGRRTDESGGGGGLGVSTRRSAGGERRRASERSDGNDFVGDDGAAAAAGGEVKTATTDGIRERIVDLDEYQRGLINLTSVTGVE